MLKTSVLNLTINLQNYWLRTVKETSTAVLSWKYNPYLHGRYNLISVWGPQRRGATGALVPPLLQPSAFWTALNWDDRLLCSWTYWATLKISPPTSKLALWSLVLCKKFSSERKFYICMQCTTFRICFDCRLNLASGLQVGQTVKFYFCTGKGKTVVQKEWINDHHQWIYTANFVLVLYMHESQIGTTLPSTSLWLLPHTHMQFNSSLCSIRECVPACIQYLFVVVHISYVYMNLKAGWSDCMVPMYTVPEIVWYRLKWQLWCCSL